MVIITKTVRLRHAAIDRGGAVRFFPQDRLGAMMTVESPVGAPAIDRSSRCRSQLGGVPVRFLVLGPVEVRDEVGPVALERPRQRALLA
jgi:hypothetical protein